MAAIDPAHETRPDGAASAPRRLRGGWYAHQGASIYVLARQWPPRFDVAADSVFPPVRPGRLAQQIRQDLWRAFQGLRGFSPVIEVRATDCGELTVRAGGRLSGRASSDLETRIQDLLNSPAHRARWLSWAGERRK
jgi:hypothetical protein